MTAVLYYRWLAAGLHDKIISQGVGGHEVYVGIRHPVISPQSTCFRSPDRSSRLRQRNRVTAMAWEKAAQALEMFNRL